jgi:excisionase family DNA binding protein
MAGHSLCAMHGNTTATHDTQPRLHSVDRVAALLSVTPRYVRTLIASGEIPSVKLGTRRLVRDEDLRAFLDRLMVEGQTATRRAASG